MRTHLNLVDFWLMHILMTIGKFGVVRKTKKNWFSLANTDDNALSLAYTPRVTWKERKNYTNYPHLIMLRGSHSLIQKNTKICHPHGRSTKIWLLFKKRKILNVNTHMTSWKSLNLLKWFVNLNANSNTWIDVIRIAFGMSAVTLKEKAEKRESKCVKTSSEVTAASNKSKNNNLISYDVYTLKTYSF